MRQGSDRKSPQIVNAAHRGSPVLSSRVNWDLQHDYSECVRVGLFICLPNIRRSDDSMSEDDLDHRQTATNSGVSDDDVLLSE